MIFYSENEYFRSVNNFSIKFAFSGSRHWENIVAVDDELLEAFRNFAIFDASACVLVGDCPRGVDKIVRYLCGVHDFPCFVYRADWKVYGKAAEVIRNNTMAYMASYAWAFLDDTACKGTRNFISCCERRFVPLVKVKL